MRRSAAFRFVTFVLALLVSLTAPALALAHGLAHDHLAHEHSELAAIAADEIGGDHPSGPAHGGHHAPPPSSDHPAVADHDGGDRTSAIAPTSHEHRHGHATVDVAPGARDAVRLDAPASPAIAPVPTAALATTLVVVRSAALTDRALLARPDPDGGPPPRLRAPPAG